MARRRNDTSLRQVDDLPFASRPRKAVPHAFVLEAISAASPWTRSMFGCLAIYVGEKIVFVLRDKPGHTADNGVWLATSEEHHASLRQEFPSMRSIQVLGKAVTNWQILPADAPGFEEAALHACELVLARDARIGKLPKARRSSRLNSAKATRRDNKAGKVRK